MSDRRTFLRGLVSLPLIGGSVAILEQPTAADTRARRPDPFDAETFVTDLLAAGCHLVVHQPIGPGAGPAYVQVTPADLAGTQTAGEREVRARWAAAIAGCPDADGRVLAVCRRRAGIGA